MKQYCFEKYQAMMLHFDKDENASKNQERHN